MKNAINFLKRKLLKQNGNATKDLSILPKDFDDFHIRIVGETKEYTMTSPERIWSLINSVQYIVKNKIQGDFVECGVWRGGSAYAMIRTLQSLGVEDRVIHLYDTFEGMSDPTENDISIIGENAEKVLKSKAKVESDYFWAYSPLDKVEEFLYKTKYPRGNIKFHAGKVEDTIPKNCPPSISLLRLDTDWYESTKHELIHLYPLLVKNGVLIIDDYGHWQGAKKAVDEYFADKSILLNRIDYTGRIALKP